jgi:hypothetical protein
MGLAVACTSGTDSGTAGNTELNLDIVNPGGTSGELGFSIDRVDYRITCDGNPPGSYPIPDADTSGTLYNYDDSVDISGAFETVDTRVPPVWQAVMDLPPGLCTITLSVYEDDEIVCVGSQTLTILEDGTTKYDIVLVCSLSVDLPDGMADVDGTFEFITGNLCPKLYVLNAIPSSITQDTANPDARTEIQYRAKDPDDTCGNNCDPQTCDFSNPPVCTPYPSNINDPACNLALGGDPNSVDCQAGVYAGLVCTISAIPLSLGTPSGNFLDPNDGVTPLGPVLPVNLNLAAMLPGVILPGLGGPAGTNAANSPAYPPPPNFNGSLPPLFYLCNTLEPGATVINLDCSDGDAECDQNKQLTIECPGINYCVDVPLPGGACDSGNKCTTNGTCDPNCDPADIGGPGCPGGTRCPGEGLDEAAGTACDFAGVDDGFCLLGACQECLTDADCLTNPAAVVPGTCQLPNTCTANVCVAGGAAPIGTTCGNGTCDGSGPPFGTGDPPCVFQACDPCDDDGPGGLGGPDCGQVPLSCNNILAMGCTNNVTTDISILPFELLVNPDPILTGAVTPVVLDGVAEFSEVFLDAAQGAVPGGVTAADLVNLAATTLIRTGGTGGSVILTNAPIPATCLIGGTPCNPINDGASVPGQQPNTDCVPVGTFNPCQQIVILPTSADCSVGGTCDLLGKGPGTSQCDVNGFCVTSGLPLPLVAQATSFTAAASGVVTYGYDDVNTNATPLNVDGTYNLPGAVFTNPAAPNEIKVNAGGLSVALECTMAVDSGGPDGVGVPDAASPTPTANLNTFNIQVP